MSANYNSAEKTGVTGHPCESAVGAREPLAHPVNCNHECPYGYGRSFCFPCYKNIMDDHRQKKNAASQGA